MSYFSELGLAEPLLRALGTKGYSDPTPIQRQSIPSLLQGRDLLGIAQTGTGKTAAFSLPSIHRLVENPQPRKPAACRMLVLSPTRELAAQIADNMREYAKYVALNVQCVFGGVPVGKQARALVPGCDILVATPGRLLDLIEQRALTLRHVEIFVLDEADQMMDLGFIVPLKRVAAMLPKERQSLFFSATMPKAIADLGKQFINDPVRVEVAPQSTTAERVEQYATFLNQAEKQALLTLRLRAGLADGSIDRALVFTRTKHGADRVVRFLTTANIASAAIHGNKSQGQRTAAIKGFRSGEVPVLVATDIAARGIDIPGVSHVFNFEMPNVPEQYVHRIGRTARAGADGISMSFIAPDEKPYLRDIEKLTRVKLDVLPLPEDFLKEAARLPAPSRKSLPVERPERSADPRGRRGPVRGGGRPEHGRGDRGRPDRARGEQPNREGAAGWSPMPNPDRADGERARGPRAEGGERAPREGGARHERGERRGDRIEQVGGRSAGAPPEYRQGEQRKGPRGPQGNGHGEARQGDASQRHGSKPARHGASETRGERPIQRAGAQDQRGGEGRRGPRPEGAGRPDGQNRFRGRPQGRQQG
jgi:ATP-dependent RNA helicase RhlE